MHKKYVEVMKHKMNTMITKTHNIHSISVIRIKLSPFDYKRYTLDEETTSYDYSMS